LVARQYYYFIANNLLYKKGLPIQAFKNRCTFPKKMYEHRSEPLLPLSVFYKQVFSNILIAFLVLAVCLLIGMFGFHFTAGASWIDAFHNSSMLLSGMGPVITISQTGGKLFSSLYALFSGIVFITNIGIILAPAIHRLFHRLHLENKDATS
jgi:hypothetical protein